MRIHRTKQAFTALVGGLYVWILRLNLPTVLRDLKRVGRALEP